MKIDPNAGLTPAAAGEAASTNPKPASAASGAGAPVTDQAEITYDRARVNALAAQVNALPEIRREKVAALQSAVKQGTYQVSPEQTAEALIAELRASQPTAA